MTDTARMVAWLRETLDAAEKAANAAARRAWSPHWEYDRSVHEIRDLNNGGTLANIYFPAIGNFSAANDPAAVLRRIAADRKILAEHNPTPADFDGTRRCLACGGYTIRPGLGSVGYQKVWPCPTISNLAEGWGWTEETT